MEKECRTTQSFSSYTLTAEAGGLQVQDQCGLHSGTLFFKSSIKLKQEYKCILFIENGKESLENKR